MTRIRSPLALLLAATLLVPGEAHVIAGGCLRGSPTISSAMSAMQAQLPASPHQTATCETHHPGQGPVRGGMRHCTTPSTCAATVALFEGRAPLREWRAEIAVPVLFLTAPSSRVAPPVTPPPRT
jgi:hypothetical protein